MRAGYTSRTIILILKHGMWTTEVLTVARTEANRREGDLYYRVSVAGKDFPLRAKSLFSNEGLSQLLKACSC